MKSKRRSVAVVLLSMMMLVAFMPCASDDRVFAAGNVNDKTAWEVAPELNPGWSLGNTLEYQNIANYGFVGKDSYEEPNFDALEQMMRNPVTSKKLIDAVEDAGFKSIRIPVSFYHHLKESKKMDGSGYHPGTTVDSDWLDRVEEIVNWSLDAGLYVIINDHHDTGMYEHKGWIYADAGTIDDQKNHLTNIWGQYADRFKDYDNKLIFQSMGEVVNPERSFNSDAYADMQAAHDLNQAFIDMVRSTGGNNASRILILPTYASNAEPIFVDQNFYKPFTDSAQNRLMYSVHNYSTDLEGLEWSFNMLYKKAVRYGMPFVMTECGTKLKLGVDQRKAVSAKLVEQAQKYGMAIIIWDDGDFREQVWDEESGGYIIFNEGMGIVNREATVTSGALVYGRESEGIIDAMFEAAKTERLSSEELRQAAKEEYTVKDFEPLDKDHLDQLKPGMYSTIHKDAYNPMSIYMPTRQDYAVIFPYISRKSFDSLSVTLPSNVKITVRQLDRDGHFIGDAGANSSSTFGIDPKAAMIGIIIRPLNNNDVLSFEDYKRFVNEGSLKITATNPRNTGYVAKLTKVSEEVQGKVVLNWTEDPEASGYRILRKGSGDTEWKGISDIDGKTVVSFADTTASPQTEYRYTVKAYHKNSDKILFFGNYDETGLAITTKARPVQPVDNSGSIESFENALFARSGDSDVTGSTYSPLRLLSKKQTNTSIKLQWKKVAGAGSYVVYGGECGKRFTQTKAAVTAGNSVTVKTLQGKKLKKNKFYKFIVVAENKGKVLSISKMAHVRTKGNKKNGNYSAVTVKKSAVKKAKKLRRGKSLSLGAKATKKRGIKVSNHVGLRYESTNASVAAVSKKGRITGKKKGSCYIYCYAQNGIAKRVKVTVY